MVESQNRVRLTLLVVALVGLATVSMVVDRRALIEGTRELPVWVGPALDIAVPVQKVVSSPVEFLRGVWSRYVDLVDLGEENRELRGQLARVSEENLQLREALVASGRLERIAEMRDDFEVPMLPVQLVGSDASPWFQSVLLDRGRGDGVRSGMAVVSEQGLVGLVVATSRSAAKAMLALDRQTAIDAAIQRSRARGIVRGQGSESLEFEFIARGGDVRTGDLVITSGLDGVYPKGVLIGTVTEVEDANPKLLRTAVVAPAVDFGRLEQAFVMLRRGPTMELLFRAPNGDTAPEPEGEAAE